MEHAVKSLIHSPQNNLRVFCVCNSLNVHGIKEYNLAGVRIAFSRFQFLIAFYKLTTEEKLLYQRVLFIIFRMAILSMVRESPLLIS